MDSIPRATRDGFGSLEMIMVAPVLVVLVVGIVALSVYVGG